MSKAALVKFIETENFYASVFKATPYDINNLTDKQVEALCRKVDCGLSPENLSCDGELSRSQVLAKYKVLAGAGKELLKMADKRGLKIKIYELY